MERVIKLCNKCSPPDHSVFCMDKPCEYGRSRYDLTKSYGGEEIDVGITDCEILLAMEINERKLNLK